MKPNGTQILSGTVTGLAPGMTAQMPGQYLRNYTNRILLVDEIRFTTTSQSSTLYGAGYYALETDLGLSAMMQVGNRYKITNGFVPLASFCKFATRLYPTDLGSSGSLVWQLHKPITLAPREAIYVTLQNNSLGTLGLPSTVSDGYNPTVGVTLVCRQMPGDYKVGQQWLPYLAAYQPAFTASTLTGDLVLQSTAADLFNPSNSPLFVKELIGYGDATCANLTGRWDPADSQNATLSGASVGGLGALDLGITGTKVQIVNAGPMNGIGVATGIRDFVPFFHAFMPSTKAWNVNAVLHPKSFLQVRQKISNWAAITAAGLGTVYARFPVGMVGYYRP